MGLNKYHTAVKAIMKEADCTWKEAQDIYRQRKENEKATAKTAEKPAKTVSTPAPATPAAEGKLKRCEKFILGRALTSAQMHRYLRSELGDDVQFHRHPHNKKQVFFTIGESRIPSEGYFRATI